MKKRLIGLETEYAIRYSSEGINRPDNRTIYNNIIKHLSNFTKIAEGTSILKWKQYFTENGSAVCYESLPHHLESGLLEAATPECDSPLTLTLYQKAIDKLLQKVLIKLNETNKNTYPHSTISLIKNCKDAFENIYGAQENYSVSIAQGYLLFLYRLFLTLYLPLLSFYILFIFSISFLILFIQSILMFLIYFLYLLFTSLSYSRLFLKAKKNFNNTYHSFDLFLNIDHQSFFYYFEKISGNILTFTEILLSLPMIIPYVFVLKHFTFKRYKKILLPFFITRILITGSGSINKDGNFYLSEKGMYTRRISRTTNFPSERCIFDSGNLMKLAYLSIISVLKFEFHYIKQLFRKEQRLQIGMSDSTMSQEVELLKVGTTYILLEMIDNNFLNDVPKLKKPLKFLISMNQYPNYKTQKVYIKNHRKLNLPKKMSAIEIQKWYLNQAKKYLKEKVVLNPELQMIVKLWEEILEKIEHNPDSLFGRIDWITKKIIMNQYLIKELQIKTNITDILNVESITKEVYQDHYKSLKIIDIKYHDLYNGYYIELEKAGLTKSFFTEDEIENAITSPPNSVEGFARIRSSIIKKINHSYENIKISWDYIKLGHGSTSKIIQLEDYKKKHT